MAMFGQAGAAALGKTEAGALGAYDPHSLSGSDKMMLFGAMLKDAVGAYNGEDSDAILKTQALLGSRQQEAQKQAFGQRLAGLIGGQAAQYAPGAIDLTQAQASGPNAPQLDSGPAQTVQAGLPVQTAPATPGLNINDPRMARVVMEAQNAGYPMDDILKVLTAQQPDVHYDRGFGFNGKTGDAMGAFHPDLEKGQTVGADGSVSNLPGAVSAAAQMAGGVEGAKAAAQAPFQAVQTFGPDGRPMTINALTLAGGANGQGGAFVGQSPAQTAADTARATAGAQADINLPQTLSTANQAIGLIEQMKGHHGLDSRTGWRGMIPALPNTPGADFAAMQDQLKGKIFLQAYGDLRGGGSITEIEGRKATDALARLNNTQTKEGYLKALSDLEEVINTGAMRAAQQSQRMHPNAAQSAPRPAATPTLAGKGYRIIGVK